MEMGKRIWDRFTVHYTPKHGSWLNQAEIEIGLFCAAVLGREENIRSKGVAEGIAGLESRRVNRAHKRR